MDRQNVKLAYAAHTQVSSTDFLNKTRRHSKVKETENHVEL